MEKDILTSNGMDIHLVRYFEYNGAKYLIFTTDGENEKDDQGHVFVHIANVDGLVANAVEGETYETAKNVIKDIVSKNRNNLPLSITDLNYNELNGLNIVSDKQLGLLANYVDILKQNQPDFAETPVADSFNNFNATPFATEVNEEPQTTAPTMEPQTNESNFNMPNPFNQFTINEQPSVIPDAEQNQPNITPSMEQPNVTPSVDNQDYEKMYLEQVELVNKLNSELEIYKNKIETLKNIINN